MFRYGENTRERRERVDMNLSFILPHEFLGRLTALGKRDMIVKRIKEKNGFNEKEHLNTKGRIMNREKF